LSFNDRLVVVRQRIWNSAVDQLEGWLVAHGDGPETQSMLPKSGTHFSEEQHAQLFGIDHVVCFLTAPSKSSVI